MPSILKQLAILAFAKQRATNNQPKIELSDPSGFFHQGHIGCNAEGGMDIRNVPLEYKSFLRTSTRRSFHESPSGRNYQTASVRMKRKTAPSSIDNPTFYKPITSLTVEQTETETEQLELL